jgi:hypothetical protein
VGRNASPFSPQILAILGVDHYVTRNYWHQGGQPVGCTALREPAAGDTMHSPSTACLAPDGYHVEVRLTIRALDGAQKRRETSS